MSSARDRLLAATARLCADAEALVLSHHDLHCCPDGSGTAPAKPDSHGGSAAAKIDPTASTSQAVATSTACVPAATDQPGRVRVAVPVSTYDQQLPAPILLRLVAGSLGGQQCHADTSPVLPAGQDHVEVWLPPTSPVGPYLGELLAPSGAPMAPVVLYLDGPKG